MSNRIETITPGDVLVMMNHGGYWALLMLDDVVFRLGPNGYEAVAVVRYVIAADRTARDLEERVRRFRSRCVRSSA